MPVPETWGDWVLSAIISTATAMIAWVAKRMFGRLRTMELRIVTLERIAAVADHRHTANIKRLESIERRGERIEDKLDRLIERL